MIKLMETFHLLSVGHEKALLSDYLSYCTIFTLSICNHCLVWVTFFFYYDLW